MDHVVQVCLWSNMRSDGVWCWSPDDEIDLRLESLMQLDAYIQSLIDLPAIAHQFVRLVTNRMYLQDAGRRDPVG